MDKSWHLVDAEQIAKEAKYTFYKPSKAVYEKLQPGNVVKLIFEFESDEEYVASAERMWVLIIEINAGKYKGTLDNEPLYIKDLKYEDEIEFEEKHIIATDIEDPEESITEKYIHRCIVSNHVLKEGKPVKYLYREEGRGEVKEGVMDSGWIIMSGEETQEYADNNDNFQFVSLGAVLRQDDSIVDLLDASIGSAFGWNDEKQEFEKIEE